MPISLEPQTSALATSVRQVDGRPARNSLTNNRWPFRFRGGQHLLTMRRRKKAMPIPQWEFGFSAEAFNLVQETTVDGERISRERLGFFKTSANRFFIPRNFIAARWINCGFVRFFGEGRRDWKCPSVAPAEAQFWIAIATIPVRRRNLIFQQNSSELHRRSKH
jgi:hypothetical protein